MSPAGVDLRSVGAVERALRARWGLASLSVLRIDAEPDRPPADVSLRNAAPKRQREFAAGRRAARRALRALGAPDVPIPRDPRTRAPRWPEGIVGSITHDDVLAAAVCAHRDRVAAIGLDLEPDLALEDDLRAVVCTRTEARALTGPDAGRRLRWTFSAKEAFYKAQHPLTGRFLEFTDVELTWDITQGGARFAVRSTVPGSDVVAQRGEGQLAQVDGHIFTLFRIR